MHRCRRGVPVRERERMRHSPLSSARFSFHPFFLSFFLSSFLPSFLSRSPADVFSEHNKQTPPRNLFSYVRGICQSTPLSPPSGSLSFFLFSPGFGFFHFLTFDSGARAPRRNHAYCPAWPAETGIFLQETVVKRSVRRSVAVDNERHREFSWERRQ